MANQIGPGRKEPKKKQSAVTLQRNEDGRKVVISDPKQIEWFLSNGWREVDAPQEVEEY